MKSPIRCFFVFAILLAFAAGCSKKRLETNSSLAHGVTIVVDGEPITLDPVQMTEVLSATLGNACHSPLVRVNAAGQIQYELASSIAVSEDGLRAHIKLKPGCRFWDHSPVRHTDVAWSLARLRDSQSPLKLTTERISRFEELATGELLVHFSSPEPDFVQMLAHLQASIIKKDTDRATIEPLSRHLIGAGAFAPDKFVPGVSYSFRRNPGFPFETNVEILTFIVKTDTQAQISACLSGKAEILRLKGPALREAVDFGLKGQSNLRAAFGEFNIHTGAANEISVLILNWSREPMSTIPADRRRESLHAVSGRLDREQLSVALGGAEPANHIFPPKVFRMPPIALPTNDNTSPFVFAKALEVSCSTDPMSRELAGVTQPLLAKAGLACDLRQADPGRLVESVLKGTHQSVIITFEMPVVGVLPWLLFFQQGPFAAFGELRSNLSEKAAQARSTLDPQLRAKAWSSVASDLDENQTAWLPLVSRSTFVIAHKKVSGVLIDAAGTPYWTHLRVE